MQGVESRDEAKLLGHRTRWEAHSHVSLSRCPYTRKESLLWEERVATPKKPASQILFPADVNSED